jgi:hypothetical protein
MKTSSGSLLLALSALTHCVFGGTGSYDPSHSLNIATIVSTKDAVEDEHSLGLQFASEGESLDFVLVGNTSITNTSVAGLDSAAEGRVLYETARWSLVEGGSEDGKFLSFWARFQAVNVSATSSVWVCTMVAEWNTSWSEKKSALAAVDVEERLQDKCGENDTIALAFDSAVSHTASAFLQGKITVNDAAARLKLHDVDSASESEAASATDDVLFTRIADSMCPRDGVNIAEALSSLSAPNNTATALFSAEVCPPSQDPMQPPTSSPESDSSNESDWKRDLRFIIPVGICVFILGCAGLVYVYRQQKGTPSSEATPKEEEKDVSSLPYVLTMHQVV